MNRKDWNKTLDKYLNENHLHPEEYEALNEIQQAIIQEIKKSIKRLYARTNQVFQSTEK